VSSEIRYEADPGRVFSMIIDPGYQEAKCAASGSLEHEVDVSTQDDGSAVVISHRTLPTDDFPDFVRSFVGSSIRLHETQRWQAPAADGSRSGSIEVELHGAPVRFTGSVALTTDGSGTYWPVEGELKASLPFLGGKIEKAAEPAVLAAIRIEQTTGTTWLAGR
jgi:hypothetical protein